MLESHTRQIDTLDTTTMDPARKKRKKKDKKITNKRRQNRSAAGGLQLVCGRPSLSSALAPQTLSCLVCVQDS